MARAIDADAFKNEIREIGNERFLETGDQEHLRIAEMVCHYVDKQPTIDPVIRCRDCAVPHNKWTGCPKLNGLVPPDNFYCAFGVRRDSDGKAD